MSLHRSVREGIAAATLIRSTGTQGHRQQQQPAAAASVHGGVPAAAAQVARDANEDATGQEEEEEEYNELLIRGRRWEQPLNLHSIQHLVTFLRQQETPESNNNNNNNNNNAASTTAAVLSPVIVMPLLPPRLLLRHFKLHAITIQNRHGELNVLRDFFMETKLLKKVTIMACTLGRTANDVEQLLSAFYPNNNNNNNTTNNSSSSIVHLDFWRLSHLQGEALGQCLANILHNNHTLQRLECWKCPTLNSTGVTVMQPALQSNHNLVELNLSSCNIGNNGLSCLATSIANNPHSVLQILNISGTNQITINGIENGIIQLATCEQLRKIDFGHEVLVQVLRHATHSWQLARVLCSNNLYLQKLIGVSHAHFPDCRLVVSSILGILVRNKLLAPQPDTHELLDSNSGIWSMALSKFAQQSRHDDNVIHSPATCIFQILQRRPFLVPYVQQQPRRQEQELTALPPVAMIPPPPPPPPPMVARQEENNHPNEIDDDNESDDPLTRNDNDGPPNKRARLE